MLDFSIEQQPYESINEIELYNDILTCFPSLSIAVPNSIFPSAITADRT